jgi:hypothetical protein
MSALTVIAVIAVIAYIIGRQVLGEAIRGKRLIILPAVLTGIGILDLAKHAVHPTGTDILLIVIGAVIAAAIGVAQGRMMRLEERDGGLWGQLPLGGLWLWALLYLSRGALIGIAHATDAHVAASTQAELLILGINRLGQAAIVATRAMAAGIALTPEKDGSQPLGSLFASTRSPVRSPSHSARPTCADSPGQPASNTAASPDPVEDPCAPTGERSRWGAIARQLTDAASDAANARMQDRRTGRPDRHRTRRRRPR